jgi:CxxC motif-containing protein
VIIREKIVLCVLDDPCSENFVLGRYGMTTREKRKSKRKAEKPLDKDKVRRFICIVCPACCELETDGSEVNGSRCPKGESFARQEIVMPLRVITTTVRCETPKGVRMLPVKTACPVPLSRVPAIMRQIKSLRLSETPPIGSHIDAGSSAEPVELIVTGEFD